MKLFRIILMLIGVVVIVLLGALFFTNQAMASEVMTDEEAKKIIEAMVFALFPQLKIYLVYAATTLGAILAVCTALFSFGKVVVKATWWTTRDDKLLKKWEVKFQAVLKIPIVGRIIKLTDRFSILKDKT